MLLKMRKGYSSDYVIPNIYSQNAYKLTMFTNNQMSIKYTKNTPGLSQNAQTLIKMRTYCSKYANRVYICVRPQMRK